MIPDQDVGGWLDGVGALSENGNIGAMGTVETDLERCRPLIVKGMQCLSNR